MNIALTEAVHVYTDVLNLFSIHFRGCETMSI